MNDTQFWAIIGMMAGGFGWVITWLRCIDRRLNGLETRVTVLETRMGFIERLLEMMGFPNKNHKERTEP